MKAITVKQPWASAIIHGGKDVENRSTNIVGAYRGPLAIIAGKTKADITRAAQWPMLRKMWDEEIGYPLVLGAIIGVVDLVDVHRGSVSGRGLCRSISGVHSVECGSPWGDPDALHLILKNARPLPEPIPFTGFLGCRALPADVVAQIEEQLR